MLVNRIFYDSINILLVNNQLAYSIGQLIYSIGQYSIGHVGQ